MHIKNRKNKCIAMYLQRAFTIDDHLFGKAHFSIYLMDCSFVLGFQVLRRHQISSKDNNDMTRSLVILINCTAF